MPVAIKDGKQNKIINRRGREWKRGNKREINEQLYKCFFGIVQ